MTTATGPGIPARSRSFSIYPFMNLLSRIIIVLLIVCLAPKSAMAAVRPTVVADSVTHTPLSGASVFDSKGNMIGIASSGGIIPYASQSQYPLTVRFLGYAEATLNSRETDTVFMQEIIAELPEVLVESRKQKVLHLLAYVREYSTLATYSDTVFLFREKMVDYMLPDDRKNRFKGWNVPRILKSQSYYRFTDICGKDSVSGQCNQHFSWSDWIGLPTLPPVPSALRNSELATDTLHGRYSPVETWLRKDMRISANIDVLADSAARKWAPNLSHFFRREMDFEKFRMRFNFADTHPDTICYINLSAYS
ncbi:MAG: hypothetical protein K2F79_07980, partial [Muribaculaceae bacterium]|nr:hypothetical protein [Muribaculaceae bacterium]